VGAHDRRRPVALEPGDHRPVAAQERHGLVGHGAEDRLGPTAARDQSGHASQRGLLGGELVGACLGGCELGAALGIRNRRRYELGEVCEPGLGVYG
jgi:hypothetical protein